MDEEFERCIDRLPVPAIASSYVEVGEGGTGTDSRAPAGELSSPVESSIPLTDEGFVAPLVPGVVERLPPGVNELKFDIEAVIDVLMRSKKPPPPKPETLLSELGEVKDRFIIPRSLETRNHRERQWPKLSLAIPKVYLRESRERRTSSEVFRIYGIF